MRTSTDVLGVSWLFASIGNSIPLKCSGGGDGSVRDLGRRSMDNKRVLLVQGWLSITGRVDAELVEQSKEWNNPTDYKTRGIAGYFPSHTAIAIALPLAHQTYLSHS